MATTMLANMRYLPPMSLRPSRPSSLWRVADLLRLCEGQPTLAGLGGGPGGVMKVMMMIMMTTMMTQIMLMPRMTTTVGMMMLTMMVMIMM